MFVCDEWRDCAFITRHDGKAIIKLVYIDSFWEGVQEVCKVSQPLVEVLCLVDGDNRTTGYLCEAMDVDVATSLRHSHVDETTCGICGGPWGVTHGIDLSYVVDVGGPCKKMKNGQVRPSKYEESPRKYLLDPIVMKE